MITYFAYGSNINLTSLRAKGVEPIASKRALLHGWKLLFNVKHWFRHEGGVGNIQPSSNPGDFVEGMLHVFPDEQLNSLDSMESYGFGYDRIVVPVETDDGKVSGFAYVGLPEFLDDHCLPSRRYLNIITRGAEAAGLSKKYVNDLRRHAVHVPDEYPPFAYPADNGISYTAHTLAPHKNLTALSGAVFDMQHANTRLACLLDLFGGKDMTLFHVKRHDTSSGNETEDDILAGNITPEAKKYINAYLHEYAREFIYVARFKPEI